MFIKLSFNANTRVTVPLRILADIINTNTITSVSTLQSRFTSASYSATLTSTFDAANSTIIRTVDPSNTKAHVSYWSRADYGDIEFTIEQPVYDASSSKIYTQLKQTASNSQQLYFDVGTAITGGAITATGAAVTSSEAASAGAGTQLTLGGNNLGPVNVSLTTGGYGYDTVRTFWAYVTDKCFFFAITNGTSYNSGWGATYTDSTKFCGPYFQTQYTRYDYHNSDTNGVYPVLWTSQRSTGYGYGTSSDLTSIQNLNYAVNSTTLPLRVNSLISALPQVGTAWPKIYNQPVHMTFAGRSSSNAGLNQVQSAAVATSATGTTYAGGFSSATATRYPNATLTATGFGLMPFGWEANYYGNHGGNASDQCGVYIFNGDYVPGDTFTYNNKVYMIWPMWSGYSNRVGFAVPME